MHETPSLECDLILQGGLTSGVIYPQALCEVARVYRLRSVGGSSAGAIAAAAAAAAEFNRVGGGFTKLGELSAQLAEPTEGGTRLLDLFQPQPRTGRLFQVATALVNARGRRGPTAAAVAAGATVRAFWWHTILGALPGLVLAGLAVYLGGPALWVGVVASLLVAVAGGLALAGFGLWRSAARDVPANNFGLCDGGPTGRAAPALTPWLHGVLQDIAGRPASEPLTFGELEAHGVDLQMVTTNLTQARPMTMPWPDAGYYYDPVEWRRLFPAEVVDWLDEHPPEASGFDDQVRRLAAWPLRPLPAASDLPVVVAARLSLSFPLLLSAVRLYGLDYGERTNRQFRANVAAFRREHPGAEPEQALADEAVGRPHFAPNWFSDGGLTSNLPLHFFDAPLPTRPTFAMNLLEFRDDADRSADEADNSFLPEHNGAGVLRRWRPLEAKSGALPRFGELLFGVLVSWVDESAAILPGYRDRVVRVFYASDEGGFNLAMSPEQIARLGERGRLAAAKLVEHFAGDAPGEIEAPGWQNHRWVRFRSTVGALSEWLDAFGDRFTRTPPATTPYVSMLGPGAPVEQPSYRIDPVDEPTVAAFVADVLAAAEGAADPALTKGVPRPLPTMRIVAYDRPPTSDPTVATPDPTVSTSDPAVSTPGQALGRQNPAVTPPGAPDGR